MLQEVEIKNGGDSNEDMEIQLQMQDEVKEVVSDDVDDDEESLVKNTDESDPAILESKKKKAFIYLYISHTLSSWGDRVWEYGGAIVFTYIFTSTYLPGVLFALIGQSCSFIGGSYIGNWVDRTKNRINIIRISLFLQNISVCICGIIQYYFFKLEGETVPWSNWAFIIGFVVMNIFGATSLLFSMARDIAVTKDWVVVLTRGDSKDLSNTNATMKRINLTCKVLAPFFVSALLSLLGPKTTTILLSLWNLVSLVPEYFLLMRIYAIFPELGHKRVDPSKEASSNPLTILFGGWKTYLQQNVLLASASYIFLFANGVTPGPLTNSYLKLKGVPIFAVGAFQGVGAVGGLTATFLIPKLIAKIGLAKAGLFGIWFQNFFNLLAVIAFLVVDRHNYLVYVFLTFIIVSRIGLWSFDLVEIQIMQEGIKEDQRGVVNGVEGSLTNLAYLILLALGTIFNKPEQYIIIVLVSYCALVIASVLYSVWVRFKAIDPFLHPS